MEIRAGLYGLLTPWRVCLDSKLGKILDAGQGQFTITDRDGNTPYIKKLRVVSTVTYSLKD